MKILIISQYFWPEFFQINEIACSLKSQGHEVTVLTGLPNYPTGKIYPKYKRILPFKEQWQGIKIIRVPLIPRGKASNLQLALNYLSFAFISSLLVGLLCREPYNVIFVFQTSPITQALAGIVLKKLRNIPLYLWVQDLWPDSLKATGKMTSPKSMKIIEKLVAFVYKRCDRILIQSKAFSPQITKHHVSPEKIFFFPNSSPAFYQPLNPINDISYRYNLPDGFRILFAGNIGSVQAIPTILNAAEKLRKYQDIKWLFAGDGSERKFLQTQIIVRDLRQQVFWIGSFSPHEMSYLFSLADTLLLTLRKNEVLSLTIPSKLQSYLAYGKAIVAAADGEVARIIKDANAGIVVKAEDPELLAEAIKTLRNMPTEERLQLGKNAYDYSKQYFDHSRLMKELETLLDPGGTPCAY